MTKAQQNIAALIGFACVARGAFDFIPDQIAYTDDGNPSLLGIVITTVVVGFTLRAFQLSANEHDAERQREQERVEANRITNRID